MGSGSNKEDQGKGRRDASVGGREGRKAERKRGEMCGWRKAAGERDEKWA